MADSKSPKLPNPLRRPRPRHQQAEDRPRLTR